MSMHLLLALRDEVEAMYREKNDGEGIGRRMPEAGVNFEFYTNEELVGIWDFLSQAIRLEEMGQ